MKSNQRGFAGLAALGIIIVLAIVIGVWLASVNNWSVRQEAALKSSYEDLQNVLGNYTLKVQEAAAVPDMYTADLKNVMASVMTARMGADGSKAVVQWFKEANIPFDSSLYTKIQTIVESGRNDFQAKQSKMIDIKYQYEMGLKTFPRNMIVGLLGLPSIDLEKYKPVVAGDTRQAFETGVQKPVLQRK